jgi:hypothetical protein
MRRAASRPSVTGICTSISLPRVQCRGAVFHDAGPVPETPPQFDRECSLDGGAPENEVALHGHHDQCAFASGVAALLAAAGAVLMWVLMHRRILVSRLRRLQARLDELSDHNWELRERAEQARSLLEVRRRTADDAA